MRVRITSTVVVSIAVVILAVSHPGASADTPVAVSPEASPVPCPLTKPHGTNPVNSGTIAGGYGNDALWTNLTMWSSEPGLVPVPDDGRIGPDGRIDGMKWAWYRYVPGKLTIEGRRLDAPAPPLEAHVPDSFDTTGFLASGLIFPSAGCWEITGRLGEASLTFVILVVVPQSVAARATPTP